MSATELTTLPTSAAPPEDADKVQSEARRREKFRAALRDRQKDVETTVTDFFKRKRDDLRLVDKDARLKHLQDVDQMCRYYNGDQYGDYDEGGVYQPYTLQDGDFAYTIPVINGHVDQAFMQLLKTKVEYQFEPRNRTEAMASRLAKMCEEIAVEEKDRLMTEDAQEEEIYNTILAGESYRCLLWAVNPDNPKTAKRVRYETSEVTLPGGRKCEACSAEVPEGEKACPACGASFIRSIPPGKSVNFKPRQIDVPLAENVLHIPHPMAVQRSLSALRFKHTTFVIERDYLQKHVAEWMYQTEIQTGPLTEEIRLRQELERSSGQLDAIVGSSRANAVGSVPTSQQTVQRERVYMSVAEYGSHYVSEETTLPDGTEKGYKLKVGFLGDQCPDGVEILWLGDTLVRFRPRNLNRVWSVVLYGKRPGSSRGAGLQSLIPLQDIVNDDFNLNYAIKMTSARPLTVVSRQAVKELPEAGQFLFIDKLPSQMTGVSGAVAQFPGQTAAQDGIAERIEGAMQFIGGTFSLSGRVGAPDQRAAGTATGIASITENASGRMLGPIKQRIAADKEFMFQILENIKEYSAKEQKKELVKRFGPDVVEAFFACNFRQSLKITIAENSDMPRSMALTQANMMAFAQVAQGLATAQVPWAGELLSSMADTLGIPFQIGQGRNDRREAEYRLNKLVAIEERMALKNPDFLANAQRASDEMFRLLEEFCGPQSLASLGDDEEAKAAFIFMQDHPAFMDAYKDDLFGEGTKTRSDAYKLAVIQLWMEHKKAHLVMEQATAEWTKEIQETLNPAPPPPPEPDPAQIQEMQGQEDQRQLMAASVAHEAEQEAKDADALREQAGRDADLERDLARTEHEAETQVLSEAARAALTPQPER